MLHAELLSLEEVEVYVERREHRVGCVGKNSGFKISRADVADFMLEQATDTTHLGQAPMVSY